MIFFVTKAHIENRLSVKRLKRICDDNSDGTADTDPVNQLRADASSKVRSYLEPMGMMVALAAMFNEATGELLSGKVVPEEIVRLTLDVVAALCAQRHPEVMRMDWRTLMEQCDKDLSRLRDGKTSLGGGTQGGDATPETALQEAVAVFPDDGTDAADAERAARWDDMGTFA